jgi:stress response protein YsnF
MNNDKTVGHASEPIPASSRVDSSVETLALVEEALRVDKREVMAGRVRVRTQTDTVEEMARATLDEETVEVIRVPVGRDIEAAPPVRTEDGVVIIRSLKKC